MSVLVVLRRPHLCLTYFGGDYRFSVRLAVEFLNNRFGSYRQLLCAGLDRLAEVAVKYFSAPLRVRLLCELGVNCGKHLLYVAVHGLENLNVLIELRRVDIYVDYLCLLAEYRGITGHAVREPGAYADEQVAVVESIRRLDCTVHTEHAYVAAVGFVVCALSHKRAGNRRVGKLSQLFQLIRSAGGDNAAARIDVGLLRVGDKLSRRINFVCIEGCQLLRLLRGLRSVLRESLCDVLGNVHQYRTFAPGISYLERKADSVRKLIYGLNYEIMLGDRHCNASDIYLLEGVKTKQTAGNIAGYSDQRHGVHVRCGNASDEVSRARSGGRDNDARSSGGTRVAVRRVTCSLFMAGDDVLYFVAVLVQTVINIENSSSRITENGIRSLFEQTFNYNIRSAQLHEKSPFFCILCILFMYDTVNSIYIYFTTYFVCCQ